MKTLYEAASALEAHMLQDLLKQEGIDTTIQGAFLQGAVGELPAAGLVRLLVEEDSYDAAHETIRRWESTQVSDPVAPPPKRASSVFLAASVGLVIGVTATYAFLRSPMSVDGIDHNRDGVLDERWIYSPSGALLSTEADRNLDGKPDYISYFDQRGHIESAKADDNFDGVFETRYQFNQGNVEYSETDSDGDAFPDLRSYYKNGVLVSTHYINSLSGHTVRIETFRLGRVVSADADTDGDGVLDTRYEYTASGAIAAASRITPPN